MGMDYDELYSRFHLKLLNGYVSHSCCEKKEKTYLNVWVPKYRLKSY